MTELTFFEGAHVNRTSASKECIICHFRNSLDKGFCFQPNVCNGCHDVLMMSMNLNDIAILNIFNVSYCCIINGTSKSEAINLLENAIFSNKFMASLLVVPLITQQ